MGAALALAHGQELLASAYPRRPHAVGRTVITLLVLGLPLVSAARLVSRRERASVDQCRRDDGRVGAARRPRRRIFVLGPAPEERAAAASREQDTSPAAPPAASRPAAAKPRIAIMPFGNLSPDPDNAFFTDGMHEEIISTLANRAPG